MRHQRTARGGRAGQLLSSSQQQRQQRPSPCQSALSTGRRPAQRRRKRDERPDARKWCEMRGDSPPVDAAPSCLGRGCWVASAAIVRIEGLCEASEKERGPKREGPKRGCYFLATPVQHPVQHPSPTPLTTAGLDLATAPSCSTVTVRGVRSCRSSTYLRPACASDLPCILRHLGGPLARGWMRMKARWRCDEWMADWRTAGRRLLLLVLFFCFSSLQLHQGDGVTRVALWFHHLHDQAASSSAPMHLRFSHCNARMRSTVGMTALRCSLCCHPVTMR